MTGLVNSGPEKQGGEASRADPRPRQPPPRSTVRDQPANQSQVIPSRSPIHFVGMVSFSTVAMALCIQDFLNLVNNARRLGITSTAQIRSGRGKCDMSAVTNRIRNLRTWRPWDGNQLVALLDAHDGIRRAFEGFLNVGDVLTDLSPLSTNLNQLGLGPALKEHADGRFCLAEASTSMTLAAHPRACPWNKSCSTCQSWSATCGPRSGTRERRRTTGRTRSRLCRRWCPTSQ